MELFHFLTYIFAVMAALLAAYSAYLAYELDLKVDKLGRAVIMLERNMNERKTK